MKGKEKSKQREMDKMDVKNGVHRRTKEGYKGGRILMIKRNRSTKEQVQTPRYERQGTEKLPKKGHKENNCGKIGTQKKKERKKRKITGK